MRKMRKGQHDTKNKINFHWTNPERSERDQPSPISLQGDSLSKVQSPKSNLIRILSSLWLLDYFFLSALLASWSPGRFQRGQKGHSQTCVYLQSPLQHIHLHKYIKNPTLHSSSVIPIFHSHTSQVLHSLFSHLSKRKRAWQGHYNKTI